MAFAAVFMTVVLNGVNILAIMCREVWHAMNSELRIMGAPMNVGCGSGRGGIEYGGPVYPETRPSERVKNEPTRTGHYSFTLLAK